MLINTLLHINLKYESFRNSNPEFFQKLEGLRDFLDKKFPIEENLIKKSLQAYLYYLSYLNHYANYSETIDDAYNAKYYPDIEVPLNLVSIDKEIQSYIVFSFIFSCYETLQVNPCYRLNKFMLQFPLSPLIRGVDVSHFCE